MKDTTLAIGLGVGVLALFAWSRARASSAPQALTPARPLSGGYSPPVYVPESYDPAPPAYVPPPSPPREPARVQGRVYKFTARTEVPLAMADVYAQIEKLGWVVDRAQSYPNDWASASSFDKGSLYFITASWGRPNADSSTQSTPSLSLSDPR